MTTTLILGGELEVCRLGFGALHLAGPGSWGEPADPEAARRVLRRAVELGVTFIDTADAYGPEVSERLIAEALHPYPDELVIATKGGMRRRGPSEGWWPAAGRPEQLRAACEGSLRRLRVERIDLYQLHRVDPAVPLEESIGALGELQAEGKIRQIGVSNVTLEELARARALVRVVSVQNRYSLVARDSDDVLAVCARDGLAFLPWQPLGLGALAGPQGELARIAAAHDASARQVALAWLLGRAPIVLPIPGTSSLPHLEENVAALGLSLTGEESRTLSAASR
jgi:pyridoxine 4-dehydrogenase